MRDLYLRAGIPRDASAGTIRECLDKLDDDVREDVSSVLLHEARRDAYDQQLMLMTRLQALRSRLDIEGTAFWSRGSYPDFCEHGAAGLGWPLLVSIVVLVLVSLIAVAVWLL